MITKQDLARAKDICAYMSVLIDREFEVKELSGNLRNSISSKKDTSCYVFTIAPRKYDTAKYIRNLRKQGYAEISFKGSSSYANELNDKGSEFEVFKKQNHNDPRTIQKIPMKDLERVKIAPRNHKNFAYRALRQAIQRFEIISGNEIKKVVWRVKQ